MVTRKIGMAGALQTAITGFIPFVANADTVVTIMVACVGIALALSPVIYLGALAHDAATSRSHVQPHSDDAASAQSACHVAPELTGTVESWTVDAHDREGLE
jgi:hypothetical protein